MIKKYKKKGVYNLEINGLCVGANDTISVRSSVFSPGRI